jgi:hypothetical protein
MTMTANPETTSTAPPAPSAHDDKSTQTASFLVADFGSVYTRVVLVDVVEGVYRLVARGQTQTTRGYPFNDVGVGVQRILHNLHQATGRTLLNDDDDLITPEDSNRRGVDYFLATASAGRPLRAVLLGILPDVSLASAYRAVAGTYVEPVASFHIKDGLNEEDRLNILLSALPDLILITGGTDGGTRQSLKVMINTVKLALETLDPTRRPIVLYAGNKKLASWVQKRFQDITRVFVTDNVRPSMYAESLDMTRVSLARAYDQHKEQHSAAYRSVANLSAIGIQPTAISYSLITEYFSRARQENVLALDMGSATTTLIGAFNGDLDTSINTTMGLGHSATSLLEQVGMDAIRAWLPFYITRQDVREYALNKTVRPITIPATLKDLYLEHAFLRAGLRYAIQQARPTWRDVPREGLLPSVGLVILGGAGFTQTGNGGLTMQLVADTVQPVGITEVKADPNALIPALGAIARLNTSAVTQLLDGNNLDHVGTLISVQGNIRMGKTAVKLKITTQDGEIYEHTIDGGDMWLLPLPTGRELAIDIQCSRGITIGKNRRIKRTFYGGTAGILFDMRGRPLPIGLTVEDRAKNMPHWWSQASGEEFVAIPDSWLEPVEEVPDTLTIHIGDDEDDILSDDDKPTSKQAKKGKKDKKSRKKDKQAKKGKKASEAVADDADEDFLALLEDDEELDEDALFDDDDADDLDDLRKML